MSAPRGWREQKLSLLGPLDEFVMTVLTLCETLLILISRSAPQHRFRQAKTELTWLCASTSSTFRMIKSQLQQMGLNIV